MLVVQYLVFYLPAVILYLISGKHWSRPLDTNRKKSSSYPKSLVSGPTGVGVEMAIEC